MQDKTCFFHKMQACGNDFVIMQASSNMKALSPNTINRLANRRTGIGFDQLLTYQQQAEHIIVNIYNADGSVAAQCGNGLRCVAKLILDQEPALKQVLLETQNQVYPAQRHQQQIKIDMGRPIISCSATGLAKNGHTASAQLSIDKSIWNITAVSMGNPHFVIFLEDELPNTWQDIGKQLSQHPDCPGGANVSFVQIKSNNVLETYTIERGVGRTLSCGSAACAITAAAIHHAYCQAEQAVTIQQEGGNLLVAWPDRKHNCSLIGEAQYSFYGQVQIPG